MTTATDDRDDEAAFEALLAGRHAPEAAAGLAAFTGAVRGAAAAPGRPSAALAELLSTGLLTDQSSPSARTAPTAGTARSRRTRRRPPVITALVVKFLSAGAVAQAAAGAGVVVVLAAGAGTAGVLPGDLQTAYSQFTGSEQTLDDQGDTGGSVSGDEDGEPGGTTVPPLLEEKDVVDSDEATDAQEAAIWELEAEDIDSQEEFTAWLAVGKERGWVTGKAVSVAAHARNQARKADRDTAEETPVAEVPAVEAPGEGTGEEAGGEAGEPVAEVGSDDDAPGNSDGKGGGNGKGKGRG